MSNELSNMTDSNIMLFDETRFMQLEKISQVMASGTVSIPRHLQNKPGDCLAVAMQAAQWGMNPFAVAQKTYFINHTISYEAQLVNAVVSTSKAIIGAFKYEYIGNWDAISGTKPTTNAGWGDKEKGLAIQVGAVLAGETEITWGEPVYLSSVQVRNSPLWKTHVKQQMAYLGVNMWARMYTPAVILGVYTPEEILARDITPGTASEDEQKEKLEKHKRNVKKQPIEGSAEVINEPAPESPISIAEFEKLINEAETQEQIKYLASQGALMKGATKAKATKLYKARVAFLKQQHEHQSTANQDAPEPAIGEAYRMLNLAKTQDDLDVIVDLIMSLNKEGKISKEEIEEFDKAMSGVSENIASNEGE